MEEPEELETTNMDRALATTTPHTSAIALSAPRSGVLALASMSEDDFNGHVEALALGYKRLKQVQERLMRPGVHYGRPGGDAKTLEKDKAEGKVGLFKAGAELLFQMCSFVPGEPEYRIEYGDPNNITSPAFQVFTVVRVHRGDANGPVVGVGVGGWSTWETKNRYRNEARKCPSCGKPSIIYQKEARFGANKGKPIYWCNTKKDGCGAEFAKGDPAIESQEVGRVPNTETGDLLNTGIKMAAKRARVDGAIIATGSSDLFTQDLEDMPGALDRESSAEALAAADGVLDEDAWRAGLVQDTRPAPTTTTTTKPAMFTQDPTSYPPATKPAAKPAASSEPTKEQWKQIAELAHERLACVTDDDLKREVEARAKEWGLPWPITSTRDASKLLFLLRGLPKDGSTAPAAAPAAPAEDDEPTRARYRQRIDALIATIRACDPNQRIVENHGGLADILVDAKALGHLGFADIRPMDELNLAELMKLGLHLNERARELSAKSRPPRSQKEKANATSS